MACSSEREYITVFSIHYQCCTGNQQRLGHKIRDLRPVFLAPLFRLSQLTQLKVSSSCDIEPIHGESTTTVLFPLHSCLFKALARMSSRECCRNVRTVKFFASIRERPIHSSSSFLPECSYSNARHLAGSSSTSWLEAVSPSCTRLQMLKKPFRTCWLTQSVLLADERCSSI